MIGQITINEISHTNISTIADEDGDFEDWIELYVNQPVNNLNQFFLSDDATELNKWSLPEVNAAADSYHIVWASGKNRRPNLDHYEALVIASDIWKYKVPVDNEDDYIWFLPEFNDNDWLSGPGGIGYGDGDDGTIIPASISVYMRQTFELTDASAVEELMLFMDYDDGFIAYLNGVEIARNLMGVPGTPANFDHFSSGLHEALVYQGQAYENYPLDLNLLTEILVDGTNVLCVQAHNADAISSDLSCIPYLIAGMNNAAFQTNPTPVWFDTEISTEWHSNFKLSTTEWLYLSTENSVLDSVQIPLLDTDHSLFKSGNNWCFGTEPDPGLINVQACLNGYNEAVEFDVPAGIYNTSLSISLSSNAPDAEIHYTLDGSVPELEDPLYTDPLSIAISTVIAARAFSPDALPSPVEKNSYLINESGLSIPVISISTNPENLWSDSIGIYVLGYPDYSPNWPYYGCNFWEDWERISYIEYFDNDSIQQFEGAVGLKIFGGASRVQPQKPLRVKCRDDYGMDEINYPLIPSKPHITTFKNFNLRNGSQDFYGSRMRDAFMHESMLETNADIMGYRHVLVFLNGEYWGHHELRETMNGDFVEDNHDVNADEVTVVANGFDNGQILFQALDGDLDIYYSMFNPIVFGDPASPDFYDLTDSLVDLKNFADYTIAETYFANSDWSSGYPNNMKCWGANGSKWRHMLWDLDFGLGLYGTPTNADYITEARNNDFHFDRLCNALLNNETFRIYFINRYADLINTTFQPAKMNALGNAMRAELEPAINRHHQRWGGDYNSFYNGMEIMLNWNQARISGARNVVQNHFALPAQVNISLDVYPQNAGRIHISTIEPKENEYPWNGVYFKGVPVRITAIANPGFEFSHWNANELFQSEVLVADTILYFDSNTSFTAIFDGNASAEHIQIAELMYHPDTSQVCGDWIELYNPLSVPLNLSGVYMKDSDFFHRYDFPFNALLPPGEYLILAQDSMAFAQIYPEVENLYGSFDFGFSNSTEILSFFNISGDTIAKARYADTAEWPVGADGCGRTLESTVATSFITNPEQWFSGCVDGSPGNPFAACNNQPIISEINYNSSPVADAGDWFELWNQSDAVIDLSNYKINDGNNELSYTVPLSTILNPDEYLVFIADENLFTAQFPFVENYLAGIPFGLSQEGDCIKIYDAQNQLVQSVEYRSEIPWPLDANGGGKTMELFDANANLCDGNNWFAGCNGGSPGMAFDPDCPDLTIDIAENNFGNNITIYPNPVKNIIHVNGITESCFYNILNSQGQIIESGYTGNSAFTINIKQQSSGYYLLEIHNKRFTVRKPFIIE